MVVGSTLKSLQLFYTGPSPSWSLTPKTFVGDATVSSSSFHHLMISLLFHRWKYEIFGDPSRIQTRSEWQTDIKYRNKTDRRRRRLSAAQHSSWLASSAVKQLRHKDASKQYNQYLWTLCDTASDMDMCTSTNSLVTLVNERERYIDQVLAGETWQTLPTHSLHLDWIVTNQTQIAWLTTMLQVLACWIMFIDICNDHLTCCRRLRQCSHHL